VGRAVKVRREADGYCGCAPGIAFRRGGTTLHLTQNSKNKGGGGGTRKKTSCGKGNGENMAGTLLGTLGAGERGDEGGGNHGGLDGDISQLLFQRWFKERVRTKGMRVERELELKVHTPFDMGGVSGKDRGEQRFMDLVGLGV